MGAEKRMDNWLFTKCATMHTILFLAGLIACHQVLAIPSQPEFTELVSSTTETTTKEALRREISAHEAAISKLKSKLALVDSGFAAPMFKIHGMAEFFPSLLSTSVVHGRSSERDVKALVMLAKADKPLKWQMDYPAGSPIDKTPQTQSLCKKFWMHSSGPGTIGARASADFWKKRGGIQLKTYTYKDSTGYWSAGFRYGCSSPIENLQRHHITTCGCFEIWCPMDAKMSLSLEGNRKQCYTIRKIFGCFEQKRRYDRHAGTKGGYVYDGTAAAWHPDCSEQGRKFEQVTLF